ncbi:transporter substrate-binding domain-containing protein [Vibrio cholerae]|uniref:transporter substrate-binding domain-containing protein n=1 Tax=Vibrio cholerae TaxID=666 RepID=UPI000E6CD170|nr:transporter substrate-binding domain-containing protein [Vibrio cholerae]AYC07395.1 Putative amino acid ABC transporter, periplasmic amino acid-binding protein [Vibrio cholerae]EGR0486799.1 transporter substrate-binding domain-containing protein [Vibrio cholerae]EGR2436364.1 transporter substrate-binding domain-containing protein [Vibrio cholerae]HAS4575304.1 transporter substrate-binding domain-containing protein [Vibrio cholerae]HDZ9634830.1 transporter substrate-binding domain-containing
MMKSIATLISVVLCSFSAWAQTITAAQDPWPPFVMENAQQKGLSVDIVTAAFATQGYTVEFTIMPWSRALNDVKEGKIDILPATWFTQERTAYLTYSDNYLTNQVKFIKKAGDNFEFAGLASLNGKKVGIVRGYGYGDKFMNDPSFFRPESTDLKQNLQKLQAGRIDLAVEDELVAKSIIIEAGMNLADFAFTNQAISENPLHVTSGKANPRSEELVAAFNKGLAEIKANGTFDKLLADYGIK